MSEHNERDDASFEARAQSLFAESVENLDGRTRSKLTQARQAALEAARSQGGRPRHHIWAAFSGATTVAVLAVWLAIGPAGRDVPMQEVRGIALDDLDIVADTTDLDLLQDVEFYAWMAQQRSGGENSG